MSIGAGDSGHYEEYQVIYHERGRQPSCMESIKHIVDEQSVALMWDKIPGPLCTARDRKVGRGLGMRQRLIITSSASCDWLFMSV